MVKDLLQNTGFNARPDRTFSAFVNGITAVTVICQNIIKIGGGRDDVDIRLTGSGRIDDRELSGIVKPGY